MKLPLSLSLLFDLENKIFILVKPSVAQLVETELPLGFVMYGEQVFAALAFAISNVGPWNKIVDQLVADTSEARAADPSKGALVRLQDEAVQTAGKLFRSTEPEISALLQNKCTGIAAAWCPIHGTCSCPEDGSGERSMSAEACPLHGAKSAHAEPL